MVISLNISHSPISLNQGACFPDECAQSEYNGITNLLTGAVTGLVRQLVKSLNITGNTPGILQPWTEVSIRVRKADEIKEDWR